MGEEELLVKVSQERVVDLEIERNAPGCQVIIDIHVRPARDIQLAKPRVA